MPTDHDHATPFKRLFHLCGEVHALVEHLGGGVVPSKARRLRLRQRELLDSIREVLAGGSARELPRWFLGLRQENGLDLGELLIVTFLLNRRIAESVPTMEGRELLHLLTDEPFDLIREAKRLHPDARLLASGLVESTSSRPECTLDAEFRLSEKLFRRVYRLVHRLPARDRVEAATPYTSVLAHLLDHFALVALHQKRAAVVFPLSFWAEVHPEAEESAIDLTETIAQQRDLIGRREALTDQLRLPLLDVRREFRLLFDEELMLLAVLFQEYVAATALVEGAELLRLVSANNEELFRKRVLIAPESTLQSLSLLVFAGDVEDKDMLASAFMPEWLVDRLLVGMDCQTGIDTDEQKRFRDFLQKLDGSEDFFRNL